MTLLLALATDKFIVFAADKRYTVIEDINEYYDDMRKHYRVNDNVIIGFSGDYNTTVACINHLKKQSFGRATVYAIAVKTKRFLKQKLKNDTDMQQTVFIGGIGDGNKITLVSMNHKDNFTLEKIIPGENHFKWSLAYADISPEPVIKQEINQVIQLQEALSPERVIMIAKKCIKYVSERDNYVSENYDVDTIEVNSYVAECLQSH